MTETDRLHLIQKIVQSTDSLVLLDDTLPEQLKTKLMSVSSLLISHYNQSPDSIQGSVG